MRLLDRYLLRELLIPLGYCLCGFLIFWYAGDLIDELGDFREQGLHSLDIIKYYFYRLPDFLLLIFPIALLLALLYSLTTHARHHEIIAMRAQVNILGRLSAPYFAVGLIGGAGLFIISEFWLPVSSGRAQQIIEQGETVENVSFINSRDGRRWIIQEYNLANGNMTDVNLEWQLQSGARRRWVAESASWVNQNWYLRNVQIFDFQTGGEDPVPIRTNEYVLKNFAETPDYIRGQIRLDDMRNIQVRKAISVQLNLRDILELKRLRPDMSERERNLLTTKYHSLLAAPWTCLLIVLIAIPFGSRGGRRDAFVGVATSIFICFAYFVIQQLSIPLGIGGFIPGALAAWLPNALFGTFGLIMFFRAR